MKLLSRKALISKLRWLAKKHDYNYTWLEPMFGSNMYRTIGADAVDFLVSSGDPFIDGTMNNKQWIDHLKEKWWRIDNFMIVALLTLLLPYRKNYAKRKARNTTRNNALSKRVKSRHH